MEENQDLQTSDFALEVEETIATVKESQDLETSDFALEVEETIASVEESQDLQRSDFALEEVSETIASVEEKQEDQKDLFESWADTPSEKTNPDQEPSVTTEDLAADLEAQKEILEEPAPKPVRKGLAALLFRRFIP